MYSPSVAFKPVVQISNADSEATAKIFRKSEDREGNMHFINRWCDTEGLNIMLYLQPDNKKFISSLSFLQTIDY